MFVYMIVNDANGKYYVGKTVGTDLERHLKNQISAALRGKTNKPHLYNAIRKHGADKFRIHPLMSTLQSDADICQWEEQLISLFNARDKHVGYNIAQGGEGNRHTAWNKGKKGLQVAWNKGKNISDDHKQAISATLKGKNYASSDARRKGQLCRAMNPTECEKHSNRMKQWWAERKETAPEVSNG